MRAVLMSATGGPSVLQLAEVADPSPGPGEVLIKVRATALNFADLLQRRGTYGVPGVLSRVLGLECSGTIAAVAPGVTSFAVGDEVCALLPGGGYAELAAVSAKHVLPRPQTLDLESAAALPEATCTAWSNLYDIGRLANGESLLIHGAAGGVGTVSLQLGQVWGARVFCTAGSKEKLDRCRALGAEYAIDYNSQDFVSITRKATKDAGVDLILDNMGALYLPRNVEALAPDGRIVMIGLQGGRHCEISLGAMMAKRASLFTTSLRDRPSTAKARIVAGVRTDVWPHIEAGTVKPVIDRVFPLSRISKAHDWMEAGRHIGKIVIDVTR